MMSNALHKFRQMMSFGLVHQCCNTVLEGHHICLVQFAFGEVILAVTNQLSVLCVPIQILQKNLLHDLAWYIGELNWPGVLQVFLFSFFKNVCMFPP